MTCLKNGMVVCMKRVTPVWWQYMHMDSMSGVGFPSSIVICKISGTSSNWFFAASLCSTISACFYSSGLKLSIFPLSQKFDLSKYFFLLVFIVSIIHKIYFLMIVGQSHVHLYCANRYQYLIYEILILFGY